MAGPRAAGLPAPLERIDDHYVGRFSAMAGPCEVLLDTDDPAEAREITGIAAGEALRIERKFSRYRDDGVVCEINHSRGAPVSVDDETARLLDYADTCFELSDGLFDITSGVLRRVWTFDGGSRVPDEQAVAAVLAHVGWRRATWARPEFTLPEDMEIDLGGIGKEYAVDRAAELIAARTKNAFVVNFGGDLRATGPRRNRRAWGVGIDGSGSGEASDLLRIDVVDGALATSGDTRRFVMHGGKRLGHILNPKTGRPVEGAPRSVTVLAGTCLEAGTLSTLAYLQGEGARGFLEEQGVRFWVV